MARPVHLGLDYGTSTSKIVIRDYSAPGGERAWVLTDGNGSFRFSSRVILESDTLRFGIGPSSASATRVTNLSDGAVAFDSIKMCVAADVKGSCDDFCYAPLVGLPDGLSAADLAVVTVARLIERGAQAAYKMIGNDIKLTMTLGVPMSFFADGQLRNAFLRIARTAWYIHRFGRLASSVVKIDEVRSMLRDAYCAIDATSVPEDEVRNWIRSEAEAALWWAFQSPSVSVGPYAKVDIGAGTTNASVFRIVGHHTDGAWIKENLAFFGAKSRNFGMDAIDAALASWKKLERRRCVELRGKEEELLRKRGARKACSAVIKAIYNVFGAAWLAGWEKCHTSPHEVSEWKKARIFVIGGGSLVSELRNAIKKHPQRGPDLHINEIESPDDLEMEGISPVPRNALPFIIVAYGLSKRGMSISQVETPDMIPPLPTVEDVRVHLWHEDIYAK